MKYSAFIKLTVVAAGIATLGAGVPTQSIAKEYNVCQLETIPEHIRKRITKRADFADILSRMFEYCPDSALALTEAATASINENFDDETERKNDGKDPSGPTQSGGTPGGETPGDDGPGDDGPGDDGPGPGGGVLPG
ncbi:hypothetical protein KX928_09935 [Roseobacter sp. YSTF-M11]|uniref:Uncharacterized protein n=1 Tax=Roseobacter insulae TaxID=2859783 RepID=A0A9X1FVM0_9RHOB|nr:hypothetical protein [Roseobacter insulae]MBW4708107.1 hypothetical protein [Roseobacter insulae]